MKILLLGGIGEAALLAGKLVEDGHDVTSSLAGRTKEPKPVKGKIRIGGFGGAEGLANYLTENQIDLLIDCTHPFAKQISENAVHASNMTGTRLEIHTRKPWQKKPGDVWIEVESLEAARGTIPSDARVLLALGRQYIDLFKSRRDIFFLIRMVDEPDIRPPLADHKLLIGKPSLDWQEEKAILEQNRITHIVCRNSGGTGAYAKIEAAREMGLPVIMVSRS